MDSLADLLAEQTAHTPLRTLYHRINPCGSDETETYSSFSARVRTLAEGLCAAARPGERVILAYPSGIEFLVGFFACVSVGLVPAPLSACGSNRMHERLLSVARDCRARIALTTPQMRKRLTQTAPELPETLAFLTEKELTVGISRSRSGDSTPLRSASRRDIAFLQYTSGSTGAPKGVVVTHGALLANLDQIAAATGVPHGSAIVSWLPQFHDMGLIGTMLFPLHFGGTANFMSPAEFIQKPARWLQAISRFRAFGSVAPNFGYAYAAERIRAEETAGVDLSCLGILMCGAEPIRAQALQEFQMRFAGLGLAPRVWFPCYGLAEATLFVSGGPLHRSLDARLFDKRALAQNKLLPATTDKAVSIVNCGRVAAEMEVVVVDAATRTPLPDRYIGEIVIAGENVATGYWGRERFDSDSGEGHRVATGDLGFIDQGDLFITGRAKDLIIVRGRNLYPQDVEALSEHLTPGAGVNSAGAVAGTDNAGAEALVLAQEVRKRNLAHGNALALRRAISSAVLEHHGVAPAAILFVRPGTIPRTTSGKISRSALAALLEAGALADVFPNGAATNA